MWFVYQLEAAGPNDLLGNMVIRSQNVFRSMEQAEAKMPKFIEICCDPKGPLLFRCMDPKTAKGRVITLELQD